MRKYFAFFCFWIGCLSATDDVSKNVTPQIAVSSAGQAVAVWDAYNGNNNTIQAATLTIGGSWSAPEVLTGDVTHNTFYPQVKINSSGTMFAIWEEFCSTYFIVRAARGIFGDDWSPMLQVSTRSDDCTFPQIAVNGSGGGVAVWQRKSGNVFYMTAATYSPDFDTWSISSDVSAFSATMMLPQLAANSGGDAVAVWQRFDGDEILIEAASLPLNGSWTTPVVLSDATKTSSNPQVVINDGGTAIAVWQGSDGSNIRIYAAVRSSAGVWGSATALSAEGQDAMSGHIAFNNSGKAVVVWHRKTAAGRREAQAAIYSGGSWGDPEILCSSDANVAANQIDIAMNSLGQAVVVWGASTYGNVVVQGINLDASNVWGGRTTISTPSANAQYPQVGIDGSGNAVTVWQTLNNSDGSSTVQACVKTAGGSWGVPQTISIYDDVK